MSHYRNKIVEMWYFLSDTVRRIVNEHIIFVTRIDRFRSLNLVDLDLLSPILNTHAPAISMASMLSL